MEENYHDLSMFDFFKMFFSSSQDWKLIPSAIKERHAFKLFEYLSIKEPEMIQIVNKNHSSLIVDLLHEMFKHHGRSPGWMYTKVQKFQKPKSIDLKKYSPEMIKLFKSINNLNKKDFEMLIEQRPDETKKFFDEQSKGFELKTK